MKRLICCLALAGLFLLGACSRQSPTDPAYIAKIDQWHAGRIERLRSDTGWLTLVGLHELHTGLNSVGSAEGSDVQLIAKAPARVGKLEVGELGVVFQAAPEVAVTLLDSLATPVNRMLLDTDKSGAPSQLAIGSLVFYVIDRQGRLFVRVKDRESALLRGFKGIARFPVTERWRVSAHLVGEPGEVEIANVLGQISSEIQPGTLVFSLQGQECRVSPTGKPGEELFLIFADPTNGKTTYPAGRFLEIEPPDADGIYTVDFNKAYNPPCCFTPYATCPLPPAENVIPVAVTAGEKTWGHGHRPTS